MKRIGPHFSDELRAAGLVGLPFSWGDDGVIQYDAAMLPTQIAAVEAVYAAHDPAAPADPTPRDRLLAHLDDMAEDGALAPKLRTLVARLREVL